jgi:putative sterol carrier protein
MSLESVTQEMAQLFGRASKVGKTVKFLLDEGTVFIDLTGDQPAISNEDKAADMTITTSSDTLRGIRNGSINPMMAMMTGKLKISGDMALAMQMQSWFSK